jgi:hypothetical protein
MLATGTGGAHRLHEQIIGRHRERLRFFGLTLLIVE